jgi:K+-sensing histidine kinase KdpD
MEYENIIFEPFFRKVKYVHEKYKTLDYGLGLTLVDRIIRKHNGKVIMYNITDYSDINKNPIKKVCCEVTLPGSETY